MLYNVTVDIDDLIKGSIDMHVHHSPAAGTTRFDPFELADQAYKAGMKGMVLKDTGYPNAAIAALIRKRIPDFEIMGSLCLNYSCGGLNHHAVESSARLGARVLWMPTTSSANSVIKMRELGVPIIDEGISIIDEKGRLSPRMEQILPVVKKYGMTLATGHISPAETFALVDEALKLGIRKLFITHPLDTEFSDKVLSMKEIKQLAGLGAFIEHTLVCHLPTEFCRDPARTVEAIREIGVQHSIISTDLGLFAFNPMPVEGFRLFVATLLRNGITPEEIETMAKINPRKLLGLDDSP